MRAMPWLVGVLVCCSCVGVVQGTDGGLTPLDAGTVAAEDAGTVDSGMLSIDSGTIVVVDAGGYHWVDAGPNLIDAGAVTNSPTWLAGHPLNEWFEIPNTGGALGRNVTAFGGFALRESTSEIIIAASGGHHDSADNSVISIQLAADAPTWLVRKGPSVETPINVGYYPDGLPSARHLYQSEHVVESLGRVFMFGARFTYGDAYEFPYVDGFNLVTNQWDPPGTWASVPSGGSYGAVKVRGSEDVYTSTFFKWSAATQQWTPATITRTNDPVRWPIAYDSTRQQLFNLQFADGQGYGDMVVHSSIVPLTGSAQVAITFNPSAAFTQFIADAPTYAALDYDPDNDRFLFYCGQGTGAGRIYVVTPNATTTWDMGILALGAGSVTPAPVPGSGVNNRFRYVPALKGFVLLADRTPNVYFIRTR